jgi:hypothetical protein
MLAWWEYVEINSTVRFGLVILEGAVIAGAAMFWWAKDNTYIHRPSTLIKLVMVGEHYFYCFNSFGRFIMTIQIKSLQEYQQACQFALEDPEGFWAKQAETFEWA